MDFEETIENLGEEVADLDLNEELNFFESDPNSEYKTLKDVVIFLIDCNENLFHNGLDKLLATAEGFLKTKIITNENDFFGLILYNIDTSHLDKDKEKFNELNFEGVNVMIKPCLPDAALIKQIKNLAESSDLKKNKDAMQFLKQNFPPSKKEISLNDALWICQTEFKNFDAKNFNRRIFLFTENDNPMASNSNERGRTVQRAKDMLESEIIIELFPMSVNKPFDLKKFYLDIIPKDNESDDMNITQNYSQDRINQLNKRIRQKEFKKRRIGRCPFFLTKDVKMQVNCYSSIRKATKPSAKFIEAKNNKQLGSINNMICKTTCTILYPNQVGYYHVYGDKKVVFTKDDIKNIKNFDNFGMKLMGFKDRSTIKPYYNFRSSYFIYPDENMTEGASALFDALIKQLIAKDKVAIVKFVSREGTTVRFCALYPQKESFDEDYFQTPPGFNLVFLPYADDIRSTSEILKKQNIEAEVSEEQFEAAKKLIKKMNFDFDSRNFENPTLQKFYSTLQALALGETEIEKTEDLLRPDPEGLKNLNGADVNLRELCYFGEGGKKKEVAGKDKPKRNRNKSEEKSVDSKESKGKKKENTKTKKKAGNDEMDLIEEEKDIFESTSKKKMKVDKGMGSKKKELVDQDYDEGYSDRVLLKMLEEQGLESLTVPKLKDILTKRNLKFSSTSKKIDLQDKLKDYLFRNLN